MSAECGQEMGSDETCEMSGADHRCILPGDGHGFHECDCGVTW